MYHGLDSAQHPSELTKKGDLIYVVDIEQFRRQMAYLADQQIHVVTLKDKGQFCSRGPSSVDYEYLPLIITFDDGHITNYTNALPILKEFGFSAYFFITTDWIGQPYYMTEAMIKELNDAGMIIGSHGKTHKFLSDLTKEEINNELTISKARLETIIQSEVTDLSAPGGRIDARVTKLAFAAGYSRLFHSEPIVNNMSDHMQPIGRFAIKRNTTFDEFKRIIKGKLFTLAFARNYALKAAKLLVGNRNYERIRDQILR